MPTPEGNITSTEIWNTPVQEEKLEIAEEVVEETKEEDNGSEE